MMIQMTEDMTYHFTVAKSPSQSYIFFDEEGPYLVAGDDEHVRFVGNPEMRTMPKHRATDTFWEYLVAIEEYVRSSLFLHKEAKRLNMEQGYKLQYPTWSEVPKYEMRAIIELGSMHRSDFLDEVNDPRLREILREAYRRCDYPIPDYLDEEYDGSPSSYEW